MTGRPSLEWAKLTSPWTMVAGLGADLTATAVTTLSGWGWVQVAVAAWAAAWTVLGLRAMGLYHGELHRKGLL
jgi:hypothetical protein